MPAPSAPVTLERFAYAPSGTFGMMSLPSGMTLFTAEQPWNDNRPRRSCIPEGEYWCKPRRYNRGDYDAIEILDVEGRKHILFHKANWPHQLMGCIAPGVSFGCVSGMVGVPSSGTAFDALMKELGTKKWRLNIRLTNDRP